MNMDVHIPKGTEITSATVTTMKEPYIKGKPPYRSELVSHLWPRISCTPSLAKASEPSLTTNRSINKRITTEKEAQRNKTNSVG